MTIAIVHARACVGVDAPLVTIEVDMQNGMPGLAIAGLPETAVKEARHRVRSAIINSGFYFPTKRLTVNLAPADLPKAGGRFDLAIALGVLAASEQLPVSRLHSMECVAELALDGRLRGVRGCLPMAVAAKNVGAMVIVAKDNACEAALAGGGCVYGASDLRSVVSHLVGEACLPAVDDLTKGPSLPYPDLCDVVGQEHARRALEVAASGGHSVLLQGPPGTGKTMLASRLPGILPPLSMEEALSVAAIYSVSYQGFDAKRWGHRPFRSPHHSASSVALVGGGRPPAPGEISLAHGGILFLDELPEFNRSVLEALREPLEAGRVCISRAGIQSEFPAAFQLVAAMNPCPYGYAGDPSGRCRCSSEQVSRYQSRLSGPLLDRIDMHISVPALPHAMLLVQDDRQAESSACVRARVLDVREVATARQGVANSAMSNAMIRQYCVLSKNDAAFLQRAMETLGMSARAMHRVLRVARTLADMAGNEAINRAALSEAVGFIERRRT